MRVKEKYYCPMRKPPSYWGRGAKVCPYDPESCLVRAILPLVRSPKTYLSQEKSQK